MYYYEIVCELPVDVLPCTWTGQTLRAPDNRHMEVIRLSALRTGCLYPLGLITGTHSC